MQTKVYFADVSVLKNQKLYDSLYSLLPEERRQKADGYRFEKDRLLSVGAGTVLAYALEKANINNYEIVSDENGRPFIKDCPDIHFNLSHSGEMVMCIVSEYECGCDIEQIRDSREKASRRFFTEEELTALKKCSTDEERKNMFFRIWTFKESFMKTTGLGIKLPSKSFSVIPDENIIKISQNYDSGKYDFYEFDINGYKSSCCIKNSEESKSPTTEFIDFLNRHDIINQRDTDY